MIVTLQIAICIVLLVGAGLLVRTLRNLENVPLGMNTDGLLVFDLNPHSLHAEPNAIRFSQELQRKLRYAAGQVCCCFGNKDGNGLGGSVGRED